MEEGRGSGWEKASVLIRERWGKRQWRRRGGAGGGGLSPHLCGTQGALERPPCPPTLMGSQASTGAHQRGMSDLTIPASKQTDR